MSDAGTVQVKFTVANAEVVRQALDKLGKDGQKALSQFDASAKAGGDSGKIFSGVIDIATEKARGLAGAGGEVASGLMRLGPAGLVAGAALGVAYLALEKVVDLADQFSQKAQTIRDSAALIGTTTGMFQALSHAGAEVGLTNEQVTLGLGRLGAATEEARQAQGKLFEQVRKINPELAAQLLTAKDTSAVLDIVAKAYDEAATAQQRLALTRAFTRDPQLGLLLQQINEAGGVAKLSTAFSPKAIPDETIKKAAALRVEIEAIKDHTGNIWGQMFSLDVLEGQKKSAEYMERVAEAAKKAKDNSDGSIFVAILNAIGKSLGNMEIPGSGDVAPPPRAASFNDRFSFSSSPVPLPQGRPAIAETGEAADRQKVTAEATLNIYRETIAILGAAATPQEQYKLRSLEIAAAQEKNAVSSDTARRGLSAFVLAQQQADAATRSRVGIVTQEQLLTSRLAELQDLRAKGFIRSDAEMAAAEQLVRKEVKDTMEAMAVRSSVAPQLTQLALDAGNVAKQLDQGIAGGLRSITSEFSILNKSADGFADRLKNVALKLADAVVQAMLMRTIVQPLAGGFSSILGSLFHFADGGIMTPSGPLPLRRYAGGGVATGPQFALYGEGEQNEAYVPLPDGRTIPVTIKGMGGGDQRPHLSQTIVVSGATGSDEVKKMVRAGVNEANQRASAMLGQYDRDVLPARIPEIQERVL